MSNNKTKSLRIVLIVLALAGTVIMGYLISLHYSHSGESFCNLGEGLSCDIVNKSAYSEVLGIPISILGLLYFLGVLGVGIWGFKKKYLESTFMLSVVFLLPSLYLTGIEIFVLHSVCIFCELSKVLVVGVISVSWLALPEKKISAKKILVTIIVAIIVALGMWYIQQSPIEEGQYDVFAQCITENHLVMYGSESCSFCAKQRKVFGSSFQYVEEIECSREFANSQTDRCIARGIEYTPTWILEDENGEDVFRFGAGVQPLEDLAEASGCPLSG